jgi:uncharacterized protein YbjT (DUF2867 family)
VTVFGASGVIGRSLLPGLAEHHEVVAVSRSTRPAGDGVRWVEADVASGRGVDAALDGADVAYHLVHSLGTRDFEERDRRAAAMVSRRAAAAGVRQIVYLGGLGGASSSAHLRSRQETGERLAADGVPVTTLRAAMVIGPGSAAFETILGLVKRLPVMITPSWVSTPTQPIALDDVTRYLAGVAGNDAAIGQAFDAGGPEVMTYRQMIERIAALLGRRPRIIEVPVLTPALSALWLELVTPVNASVARPLVEGLRTPTIAREERLRSLIPFDLMPFDEAARRALGPGRGR